MLAIDTNILVRYLTGDHPVQSARARSVIERDDVFVSTTVMLESEWVLRSVYNFTVPRVCQALRAFAGLPGVSLEYPYLAATALDCAENGMDFADALHVIRADHCDGFVTFDQQLIKAAQTMGFKAVRSLRA
ncbi:type II toxin-antitoxin system VapC family toxin [soil metagenome]